MWYFVVHRYRNVKQFGDDGAYTLSSFLFVGVSIVSPNGAVVVRIVMCVHFRWVIPIVDEHRPVGAIG